MEKLNDFVFGGTSRLTYLAVPRRAAGGEGLVWVLGKFPNVPFERAGRLFGTKNDEEKTEDPLAIMQFFLKHLKFLASFDLCGSLVARL